MSNYNDWFDNIDEDFTNEVGPDLKQYMSKAISVKDLENLDNTYIHNEPTDDNAAPRNLDTEVDI